MTQVGLEDSGSAASLPSNSLRSPGYPSTPATQGAEGHQPVLTAGGTFPSNPKERALFPKGEIGILNKSQIMFLVFFETES